MSLIIEHDLVIKSVWESIMVMGKTTSRGVCASMFPCCFSSRKRQRDTCVVGGVVQPISVCLRCCC